MQVNSNTDMTREQLHALYIQRGLTELEAQQACDNSLDDNPMASGGKGYKSWQSNLWSAFLWYKTEQGPKYWKAVADRVGMDVNGD